MKKPMIDTGKVRELLFEDDTFVREFAAAAVESFTEFRNRYTAAIRSEEEKELREAGHKIKPSAQMLELDALLGEYETGKELLVSDAPEADRERSAERMEAICDQIIREIGRLA